MMRSESNRLARLRRLRDKRTAVCAEFDRAMEGEQLTYRAVMRLSKQLDELNTEIEKHER